MNPQIEPLGVYALVKMDTVKEKTAGGIYIPQQVQEKEQHGVMQGTLLAIGPECDWLTKEHVGRKVIFGRYAGLMHKGDGDEMYRLIDNHEIRAVV